MPAQTIKITGARQHNLKNLTLEIPREKLVVVTGLSGSGKSSLAFDTLYAEGQRRYVESLSAYARQFLDQMQKPDVDFIEGLSPAIAIEQRSSGGSPRSTIATTTEIYDYLRLLFSSIGRPHDPRTGAVISKLSPQQIVDRILEYPAESRIVLLAPIVQSEVGEFRDVLEKLKREGFVRARVDGEVIELGRPEPVRLNKGSAHVIEAVIDRLVIREGVRTRLADSVETALKWGGHKLKVLRRVEGVEPEQWEELKYSTDFSNPETGFTLPQLTPKHFSFNSHFGACNACHGLGTELVIDPELIVPIPTNRSPEELSHRGPRRRSGCRSTTPDFSLRLRKPSACRLKRRLKSCRRNFSRRYSSGPGAAPFPQAGRRTAKRRRRRSRSRVSWRSCSGFTRRRTANFPANGCGNT
jgi:excinuclease ABC subunit A